MTTSNGLHHVGAGPALTCRRHRIPLLPVSGPLTPADLGMGGPGLDRIVLAGLKAEVCPRCEDGGPRRVRLGPAERDRVRSAVDDALKRLAAAGEGHVVEADLTGQDARLVVEGRPRMEIPRPRPDAPVAPRPSAGGFVHIETPTLSLDDLVHAPEVRRQLDREVKRIIHQDQLAAWGLGRRPVRMLLSGEPGVGKTVTARGVAHGAGRKLVIAHGSQIKSSLVGDTSKNIEKVFNEAEAVDGIVFLDECDRYVSARLETPHSSADRGGNDDVETVLELLDTSPVHVVFAGNMPRSLDGALARRLTASIVLERPTREQRAHILRKSRPATLPIDPTPFTTVEAMFEGVAEQTDGLNGGHLWRLLDIAAVDAAPEGPITVRQVLAALREVRMAIGSVGKRRSRLAVTEVHDASNFPGLKN